MGNKHLVTDSGTGKERRQTFEHLGPATSPACFLGPALLQSLTRSHSVPSVIPRLVQVVRVRMEQILSSSLSFLLVSCAPACVLHRLQCLEGCTSPSMDSSVGCSPFWGCTLCSMEHLIHMTSVFPHSLLPSLLLF